LIVKKLLQEPLVHFLVLGAVLFAVSTQIKGADSAPAKIMISQAKIEYLARGFAVAWLRAPTPDELEGLVQNYIREEVFYREAMARGLDRDDPVIRRRLQQILELMSRNTVDITQPSDGELRVFLLDHADKFRLDPRFTFRQVFLDRARHRDDLAGDAAALLRQLRQAGEDPDDVPALGDPSLLEYQFSAVGAAEVAAQFGARFASALNDLPLGEWRGPVESAYGVHLVFVDDRQEGGTPTLAAVRDAVRREWIAARQSDSSQKFYDDLLKRYTVVLVPAPANPAPQK
jgi:hypothetical protein